MQLMSSPPERKIAALRQNPYFASLRQETLGELEPSVRLRRYSAGENIFWQEEQCDSLFFLETGRVKLFRLSRRGRELIVRILTAGETFNEVPVFDGGLTVVNAAALDETELWLVEGQAIRQAQKDHPDLADAIIRNLSKNLRMLVGKVEELSFYQVTSRLARLLGQLSREQLEGPSAERITQDQLAARLGTVREVVARSLRDLERSGAIAVNRRQIRVLDSEILRSWAGEGE